MGRFRGTLERAVALAGLLVLFLAALHAVVAAATGLEPPRVEIPARGSSRSWARFRAGLREVYLEGSPEAIGSAESYLLRDQMIADESRLWDDYRLFVPLWIARVGIQDASRIRYRHLDRAIPEARRRELAAQSLAFEPDPFSRRMPTYHRMIFLHALYDIALSFEHSPLIGCSTFALGPPMTSDGHALVARAFDMETDDALDTDKVVFLVREDGAIPFASVAWPGFVGVVTGMNLEGVFVAVHGARAGEPRAEGMPIAFSLREVLERAHDTKQAVDILRSHDVMVSHLVFVADGQGHFAVVERSPGVPAYVHATEGTGALTNEFAGPLARDPKNVAVRQSTTSAARATRIEQLLTRIPERSASARTALEALRDHQCADDERCELGDRRSIDALIATHGVVADTTAAMLWVGTGPHLSGKFVGIDLRAVFAAARDPSSDPDPETMPEDPILDDGRYEKAKERVARAIR